MNTSGSQHGRMGHGPLGSDLTRSVHLCWLLEFDEDLDCVHVICNKSIYLLFLFFISFCVMLDHVNDCFILFILDHVNGFIVFYFRSR